MSCTCCFCALPSVESSQRAEELSFFSSEVRVLGVYPAGAFRLAQGEEG